MFSNESTYWQGRMLGRYRLLQLLGQGGMGAVWLAEDTQLRRQIAIKMLPTVFATDERYLQAFEHEARAAAALEHPHILPVHDFGDERVANDTIIPYLVMPYLQGGSLRDYMRLVNGPFAAEEGLHYLAQAAQAIDYAHSQKVLHRDVKPANMLLQQNQRWLLLADFGIAKLLSSATQQPQTHKGAGTPEYMAPEQAHGHAEPASDRYSLAMVAYQLFTGQLPFKGETPFQTLIQQMRDTPPSPRQFNPLIPPAAEEILLKGLAKNPAERPPSCVAFVNALKQTWQMDRPNMGDPEATHLAPWSKLYRAEASQPTLTSPPTPASFISFTPQNAPSYAGPTSPFQPTNEPVQMEAVHHPQTPHPPSRRTDIVQHPTVPETPSPSEKKAGIGRRSVLIGGALATAAVVAAGAGGTLAYLHSHPLTPPASPPGPQKLIPGVPLLTLAGHSDQVWNAVWDSTGRYLATAGNDTRIMLWDIESYLQSSSSKRRTIAQPIQQWKLDSPLNSNALAWVDAKTLVVTDGAAGGGFYLIDITDKSSTPREYYDTTVILSFARPTYFHVSASPRTPTFALSTDKLEADLWQQQHLSSPTKPLDYTPPKPNSHLTSIQETAWSNDGTYLAANTPTFLVIIWNATTGKVQQTVQLPDRPIGTKKDDGLTYVFNWRSPLAWSPIDPHKFVDSNVDVAAVWDIQKNKQLFQLGTSDRYAHTDPPNKDKLAFGWNTNIMGLTWSPNGRYIAGTYDLTNRINIWDLQDKHPTMDKGVRLQTLLFYKGGHKGSICDIAWSPNGRYLATASFDHTVIIWKVDGA